MTDDIGWWVELQIHPGCQEDFLALTDEMIRQARKEVGILLYERHFASECETAFLLERYATCTAAIDHLHAFRQHFANRFHTLVTRKQLVVLGNPSAPLRAMLGTYAAVFCAHMLGFNRIYL